MHKNQPFSLSKLQKLTKPLIKFDDRGGLAGAQQRLKFAYRFVDLIVFTKEEDVTQQKFKRKGSHKGIDCRKGEPIFWDELKERINLSLTPTAIAKLTQIASEENLTRSEALERILRGMLQVN